MHSSSVAHGLGASPFIFFTNISNIRINYIIYTAGDSSTNEDAFVHLGPSHVQLSNNALSDNALYDNKKAPKWLVQSKNRTSQTLSKIEFYGLVMK